MLSFAVKTKPVEQQNLQSNQLNKNETLKLSNLSWSTKILTKWMCLIGVPLPLFGCPAFQFIQTIRILWFIWNVITQLWTIFDISRFERVFPAYYVNETFTRASSWNDKIDNANLAVYTIVGHAVLLFLTQPKSWYQLTKFFKILEKNQETSVIYSKCRWLTFYIISYIVALYGCFYGTCLAMNIDIKESSVTDLLLEVSGFIARPIPATTLTLFCTLAYLAYLYLKSIRISIQHLLKTSTNNLSSDVLLLESQRFHLNVLEKRHLLVCKIFTQLNRHFGFFLVMEIIYIFVGVINSSMNLLLGGGNVGRLMEALFAIRFIDQIAHLSFLTFIAEEINNEVDTIYVKLKDFVYLQRSLQKEVEFFSEQLLQMRPRINAMGFFYINRHLFPALVGTTLTYFFILLQFHLGEK